MNRDEYLVKLNSLDTMAQLKLNRLAGKFYEAHGCISGETDFMYSSHPQEQLMFQLAVIAYDFFSEEE